MGNLVHAVEQLLSRLRLQKSGGEYEYLRQWDLFFRKILRHSTATSEVSLDLLGLFADNLHGRFELRYFAEHLLEQGRGVLSGEHLSSSVQCASSRDDRDDEALGVLGNDV